MKRPSVRSASSNRQQWQAVTTAAHRQAWDQGGIVVIDGLVPMHMVDAARRELLHLHHSGGLTGTVQGANIRRDKISWLGRSPAPPDLPTLGEGAKFLLRELPEIFCQLAPDRRVVAPQHAMCAVYDGDGAFYAPHRDNRPRAAPARQVGPGRLCRRGAHPDTRRSVSEAPRASICPTRRTRLIAKAPARSPDMQTCTPTRV